MNSHRKELLNAHSTSLTKRIYAFLKMLIVPFEQFSSYLPKEGTVIDVGCGYGYISNFLSIESRRRQVIGIDVDERRIEEAKRTTGERTNVEFIPKDIRDIDIDEIGGAIMADVLHHIPFDQHRAVLGDILTKLKTGGVFVMRETDKKPLLRYYLFNYLSEVLLYPFSEKTNFYRSEDLKKLLEDIGFRVEKVIPNPKRFIYITAVFVCRKN